MGQGQESDSHMFASNNGHWIKAGTFLEQKLFQLCSSALPWLQTVGKNIKSAIYMSPKLSMVFPYILNWAQESGEHLATTHTMLWAQSQGSCDRRWPEAFQARRGSEYRRGSGHHPPAIKPPIIQSTAELVIPKMKMQKMHPCFEMRFPSPSFWGGTHCTMDHGLFCKPISKLFTDGFRNVCGQTMSKVQRSSKKNIKQIGRVEHQGFDFDHCC